MQGNFTKGLIVGSIIGASMSMLMNNDSMTGRSKRRVMKMGRNFVRNSGNVISGLMGMIR